MPRQAIGRHGVIAEVLRQNPATAEVFERYGFTQQTDEGEQWMPAGDATVEAGATLYSADLAQLLADLDEVAQQLVPIDMRSIVNTLKTCYDSEIPLDIVDLGLVYNIRVEGRTVRVDLASLTRDSDLISHLVAQVECKLRDVPGVEMAEVKLVWEPPWSPDRMSDYARQRLGLGTPPEQLAAD